jgi:hypothetical protein
MGDLVREGLTLYGPLGIGWIVAAVLGWRLYFDTSKVLESARQFEKLIDAYHDAIVDNTKVTERLAMLIEERSRIQQGRIWEQK